MDKRTKWSIALTTLTVAGLVALLPDTAMAAHGLETSGAAAGFGGTQTNLTIIIGRVIRILLNMVGVILFIMFLYAGFLWMTAAGNEERITKAKKIIINSVIGAVVLVGAWVITNFVINSIQPQIEGEVDTVDDVDFVEGEDPLERELTPDEIDALLDDAGIAP
jgi:hypothetical protein